MFKKIAAFVPLIALLGVPAIASAHVIVTPGQTGVGSELTFNVSVPDERNTPVTQVKLTIPNGVTGVTPTAKSGWTITADTNGDAKDPKVTTITWSSGTIPVGQRDDFSFSAQVPGRATNLDWKAYQTYGDGTTLHWDQTPDGKSDDSVGDAGPYTVTHVVNDLTSASTTAKNSSNTTNTLTFVVALLALILAIVGFLRKP